MWPDRVLNPGPLTYESGALPTALRSPASLSEAATNSLLGWLVVLGLTDLLYSISSYIGLSHREREKEKSCDI